MKLKPFPRFAGVAFVFAASHHNLLAQNSFTNTTPGSDYATAANWSLAAVPNGAQAAVIGSSNTRSAVYNSATSFSTTGRLLIGLAASGNGSLTMGSSAGTLTYGGDSGAASNLIGVDGGTGSLTMNGGILRVNGSTGTTGYLRIGANAGTGTVTVNAGLLDIGHSANLGARFDNGAAAVNSSGTLTVTGTGQVIVGSGTSAATIGGNNGYLYLKNSVAGSTGSATVNLDGGSLTAKRIVAGTGGGTKTVNFNGGILIAGASDTNFLDAASGFTANVKDGGAKFDTQAFNITVGAALVANGIGGLEKSGGGTLTLTGTNTYTGNTTITTGTLEIGGAGQLNSGAYAGNIANAGTLNFNSTANQTLSGNLSGAGALTKNASGVLTLSGSNSLYTGNTTITAGTLAFSGGINRLATTGTITIGASGTLDLGGNTQTTTGLVTFASGATLKGGTLTSNNAALGNNNVYTGTINLGAGGAFVTNRRLLVAFGGTSSLTIGTGSTGSITFGGDGSSAMNYVGVDGGNGTLNVNGGTVNFNNASAPGTGNGYLNVGSNNNSSAGSIVVNGGNMNVGTWLKLGGNFASNVGTNATSSMAITSGTVTVGGGSDTTSNGVLFINGGAGDNTVNTGNSTLTLNSGGVLNVKQIQAGNQGTKTINFDGGTLRAGASSTSFLDTATGLTVNVKNGGAAIDTQAFNVAVGAALVTNGTGGLTKSGSGTLTLTSALNSYTGNTTVSDGKLIVNGNISTSTLTSVQSGATIGGSGTVGALTVSSGGFINPGNSSGILSTGNYSQVGLYTAEINGLTAGTLHDQVNVTGTVNVTGGSLDTLFTGSYSLNDIIFILRNDSTDAVTGTYSGLAQGATVTTYGGYNWQISYQADSVGGTFTNGNDIALMAVPEPRAALLGGLGLLVLLRRRRSA